MHDVVLRAAFWLVPQRSYKLHRRYIVVGITSSTLYFSAGAFFREGHGGSMKKNLFVPQQPSGSGFQSLYTGCASLRWPNFGQVNGGSMSYIVATSSSELHLQHYTFLRALFFARATEVV